MEKMKHQQKAGEKNRMQVTPCLHKGEKRLRLQFPYDEEVLRRIQEIPDCRWSATMHSWHVPDNNICRTGLRDLAEKDHLIAFDWDKKDTTESRKGFDRKTSKHAFYIEKFRRYLGNQRYSENTVQNYISAIQAFLDFFWEKDPESITSEDIDNFNERFIIRAKRSGSYQNIFISALKLFYRVNYTKRLDVSELQRPRNERRLPQVFNKEEISRILGAPVNIKHRAMLSTLYACGLRCGDLLRLKPEDFDSNRLLIHIKRGKGNKDRVIPLSGSLLKLLREYYRACRPKKYLFEGYKKGEPYSEVSLRQVFHAAVKKAGINRPAQLHWLRHSYATHLLENGTDLRYIQQILGHASSKTTEIYTHVSMRSIQNIHNPFDDLEI